MDTQTQPIPVVTSSGARRSRWPVVVIALLAVLAAALAVTTAIGFLRPVDDSRSTAEIARLRAQVTSQAGEIDAAKHCIAGYEAQRKEQAGAITEAQDAIGDARDAIGKLTSFDFGGATTLAGRAAQRIGDASRRIATADRSRPDGCEAFVS